jgi:long-chain fatty acid transport protein
MKSHKVTLLVLGSSVLVALFAARPATAGGVYANEYGTPEMGTAGAGAEASALDASTAIPFYNPAGMTRLKGNQFIVAGGALFASAEFDLDPATTILGGNGGEAASPVPILTAAYVHSFTEQFKFGAAMFAAAGAALEYEPTWAGRRQSQRSEILALSLSPTLAYRVSDWFSFGAGVNIIASALDTQVGGLVPTNQIKIDGSDTQISYNASLMFEPGDKTRIGVSYVSETEFDYAGDITRTGVLTGTQTSAVNTTLTLAQVLRVGLHYDISPKAAIVGTLGWEDWSALESQLISIGTGITAPLPRNWEDTYRYGVGFHYKVSDPWLLRFGVNYDTSPTRAADRTADLPVDSQLRLAGGFQNVRSDKFSWGAELLFADLGDAEINNSGLVGSYKSNEYLGVAFNFQWRF